jgi:hypothetical protein
VKLTARTGLGAVATVVGDALRREGIRAVLTGGACANLYTGGRHQSVDADFIVGSPASRSAVDLAMEKIGFVREGDRYVHAQARFYVEFPRGPLAIGSDYRIRPVEWETEFGRTLILSATDSCRDRLAAFYHWGDRQSLRVAVRIAIAHRVSLVKIRRWSIQEGARGGFEQFANELKRARARK